MKLRTANDIAKEERERDPYSRISASAIRRWGKENRIHSVLTGTRVLYDYDEILNMFGANKNVSTVLDN